MLSLAKHLEYGVGDPSVMARGAPFTQGDMPGDFKQALVPTCGRLAHC
jgi:hypothetical protein